jgi:hypothetical protein
MDGTATSEWMKEKLEMSIVDAKDSTLGLHKNVFDFNTKFSITISIGSRRDVTVTMTMDMNMVETRKRSSAG